MIFVPANVSCIFSPSYGKDAKSSGSIGVGFTLNLGIFAETSENLLFNQRKIDFPTVDYVLKRTGLKGVKIRSQLPLGCGFGISGASALAAALLSEKLSYIEAADLAHEAEVVNLTGLGDVGNQTFGGVVVRKNAACPSALSFEKFYFDVELDFLVLGELSTKEVLKENRSEISEEGRIWTKEFLKKPCLENLFHCSYQFAKRTGLIEHVEDAVEAVISSGGLASMVMLGKSVFAYRGFEALSEFGKPFKAKISCCGVRWVEGCGDSKQTGGFAER